MTYMLLFAEGGIFSGNSIAAINQFAKSLAVADPAKKVTV